MRVSFLIDDIGGVHPADSFHLRQQTGGLCAGDAFNRYAVCNLGYVGGHEHKQALQLFVRPDSVTSEAYVQAVYMLRDLAPKRRVVLSAWSEGRFEDSMHADGATAAATLTAQVARRRARARSRLKSREFQWSEAPRSFLQCLAVVCAADNSARLVGDDPVLLERAGEICDGRYVVFERASSCFVLHSFGTNNPLHALDWYRGNIGAPLRKGLDLEYSWFCNAAYRRALTQHRPLVEAVDAFVELPRRERLRRQYHRLIVPLGEPTHPLVLVATVENRSIDLLAA